MFLSEARHYYKVKRYIPVGLLFIHLTVGWFTTYHGAWFILTHVILAVFYKHWNTIPKTEKPDISGQVCVITGVSEGGIGFFIANKLLNHKAKIIIACRNLESGDFVKALLKEHAETSDIEIRQLDLSSLKSIQNFVTKMKQDYKKIDILINNAGGSYLPGEMSVDGYELCWATNYLGQVSLTEGLLPLLNQGTGRIVFTSSSAQDLPKESHSHDVKGDDISGGYFSYARSKICLNMYNVDLQERLNKENSHIITTAFHPGTCFTPIWSKSIPHYLYLLVEYYFSLRMRSADEGAETAVFLACSNDKSHGGKYFYNNMIRPYNPVVLDSKERIKLAHVTHDILSKKQD